MACRLVTVAPSGDMPMSIVTALIRFGAVAAAPGSSTTAFSISFEAWSVRPSAP